MRYPKNSEALSDSTDTKIGIKDLSLLLRLTKAGRDHRKVLRMLHIQASVDMPISWWIQYDTYKVATVANSRSRMHKMGTRRLTKEDFYVSTWTKMLDNVLFEINVLICNYQKTKNMSIWHNIIDLIPMSYQQERMIDINYETALTMLQSRYNEKLTVEWRYFLDCLLINCNYLQVIWDTTKT